MKAKALLLTVALVTGGASIPQSADAWMSRAVRALLKPTPAGPEAGSMEWCTETPKCKHHRASHAVLGGIAP